MSVGFRKVCLVAGGEYLAVGEYRAGVGENLSGVGDIDLVSYRSSMSSSSSTGSSNTSWSSSSSVTSSSTSITSFSSFIDLSLIDSDCGNKKGLELLFTSSFLTGLECLFGMYALALLRSIIGLVLRVCNSGLLLLCPNSETETLLLELAGLDGLEPGLRLPMRDSRAGPFINGSSVCREP